MDHIKTAPFYCEEIFYSVRKKDDLKNPIENLKDFISTTFNSEANKNVEKRGIIICRERIQTDYVAEQLTKLGVLTFALHSRSGENKIKALEKQWSNGAIKIIAATTTFVNILEKKPVQFVVHWTIPTSFQTLIKESRFFFEKETTSLIYFSAKETRVIMKSFQDACLKYENRKAHEILYAFQLMIMYCQDGLCRHGLISKNMGMKYFECKNHCDVCKIKFQSFWVKNAEEKERLNKVLPEDEVTEKVEEPVFPKTANDVIVAYKVIETEKIKSATVNSEKVKKSSLTERIKMLEKIRKEQEAKLVNHCVFGKTSIFGEREPSSDNLAPDNITLEPTTSENSIGREQPEATIDDVKTRKAKILERKKEIKKVLNNFLFPNVCPTKYVPSKVIVKHTPRMDKKKKKDELKKKEAPEKSFKTSTVVAVANGDENENRMIVSAENPEVVENSGETQTEEKTEIEDPANASQIGENSNKTKSLDRAFKVLQWKNSKKRKTMDEFLKKRQTRKIVCAVEKYFEQIGDRIKETNLTEQRINVLKLKMKWKMMQMNLHEALFGSFLELCAHKYIFNGKIISK